MTHARFGIAAAALAFVVTGTAAQANEWLAQSQAFVAGSGETESVAYAGERPAGIVLPGSVVTGSGNNVSVALPAPASFAPRNYIAVVEGSGENQTVRHIPLPRG
jgi:hypothetical protein